MLVSNNAGPDRPSYAAKCARLGLGLEEADIFSVNHIAGPFIAARYPGARVLVLGSEMLCASVGRHVADVTSGAAWLAEHGLDGRLEKPEQLAVLREAQYDIVLCGIDINVSYAKLALACVALERGAQLIAANHDPTFPFEDGMTLPGNGSMVELLARVAAVPYVSLGKPELHILEQIEAETGIERSGMLMIGDRIDTDIELARNAGIPAFLVLTGVSTAADALRLNPPMEAAGTLSDIAVRLGF